VAIVSRGRERVSPAIEVEHRSGAMIRVGPGADRELLAMVVAVLDGEGC
jgi:hypothetical protein